MSNSEEVSLEELLGLTPPKTPPQQKQQASSHQPTQPAQEKTPQNPTPKTPKQLSIQERRNKVIALILQRVAVTDIAKQLNVDRSTIYADFEEWVKTEQANHLLIEWHQQYEKRKDDPESDKAFDNLTKVVMKIMEKQAKIEVNVSQTTNIDITSEVDQIITFSRDANAAPTPEAEQQES